MVCLTSCQVSPQEGLIGFPINATQRPQAIAEPHGTISIFVFFEILLELVDPILIELPRFPGKLGHIIDPVQGQSHVPFAHVVIKK
jgi:hypothetical protein